MEIISFGLPSLEWRLCASWVLHLHVARGYCGKLWQGKKHHHDSANRRITRILFHPKRRLVWAKQTGIEEST